MKKLLFILLLPLVLLTQSAAVRLDQSEEAGARIKAIYIYNFTKYIEWPAEYKEGNFVIGVYGTSIPLLNELNKMAASKTVGSQKMEIKNLTSAAEAAQCHIVYILADNSSQLADVVGKIKGKSTLIVTDKAGMAKLGAGINFSVVENKQKIELNRANIEKYKLKVASTLVEMAVQVK
ncbi:MAG: hypothetical protein JWO09_817 [Bacteroidetes bacterium]|nr:hypothetical protein [Bacteroidota bacterium]